MKNSKSKKLFEELVDMLMQSVSVSGKDEVVKKIDRCDQYFDKVSDEEKDEALYELAQLAKRNERLTRDNNAENGIWRKILDKLQ